MDTLIVLAPVVVLLLSANWLSRTYILREGIPNDTRLFQMIRWMLLFDFLQIFNPLQGSFFVGLFGVIYYMIPVLLMILSREYLDEGWIKKIFVAVFIIGLVVACYGFKQYWFGYYPFEEEWKNISGYVALQVYSTFRPISSFSSAAEYSYYLVMAIVIGWGYFLKGPSKLKMLALIAVVIIFAALFVESSRTPIVTATGALFVMTILSAKKTSHRLLLFVVAVSILVGLFIGMTKLETSNDLINHSVTGLTDPLGEGSTATGHAEMMFVGIIEGFKAPFGYGLGSTSIASSKFGGLSVDSEVDISNKFLATGIIGGVLYLIIIVKTLIIGFKMAHSGSMVHLIIIGLLVGLLFKWLSGGHYSVVPVLWIAIGYLDKSSAKRLDSIEGGA
jgi:hypothetical protein